VDTTEGWVGYGRMRYQCRKCGQGYYPLDFGLELSKDSRMSRKKERLVTHLAARVPYEEAKEIYEELTHLTIGTMTIHRSVQKLGSKLKEKAPELPRLSGVGKQHVTADGVMVNIREEGWKEAQVGAAYEVNESREATEIIYAMGLGERAQLGDKLYRLSGAPEAKETRGMAFVSDAASWLDEMQQLHFPHATRIVDQWHAREYVWNVANEFYGLGDKKAKEWGEAKVEKLKTGEQNSLQQSLNQMRPKTKKQKEVLENAQRYFENHGDKMDYPRYEEMGFHVGSGVAEGACKHVIQGRFKKAGMRWSRPGIKNLLPLRSLHVNQEWDILINYQRN